MKTYFKYTSNVSLFPIPKISFYFKKFLKYMEFEEDNEEEWFAI
jgi:hypothetical protein